MRRLRAAVVLCALLLTACGRGCGCVEGQTTYESLDGKVKVELVRSVRWAVGKIPAPATTFHVRVHTDDPFSERVDCERVDLAEDEAGKLVAFRCEGTKPWTVLRLHGGQRRLRECAAPVGEGETPAWRGLRPVSESVDRILGCHGNHTHRHHAELVRTVLEDEGEAAAVRAILSAADRAPEPAEGGDAWLGALEVLSPAQRAAALVPLCAALAEGQSNGPRYLRAARHCPLDDPRLGAGAVGQVRARLAKAPPASSSIPGHEVEALAWAAAIGAWHAPAETGAALCAAVPTIQHMSAYDAGRFAQLATALAALGTRCEAVARWLDPPPCGPDVLCGEAPCTPAAFEADLVAWKGALDRPPGPEGRGEAPRPLVRHRALIAAAVVQGELPREVLVRNARQSYTHIPGPGALGCSAPQPAGTPCICDSLLIVACGTPASETRAEVAGCVVTIDDAARRFEVVSRCEALGGNCNAGRVCCAPNRCEPGPDARCVPPPAKTP